MDSLLSEEIKIQIERIIHSPIMNHSFPEQGMDNMVIQISDQSGKEYIVKMGKDVMNDILALEQINKYQVQLPIPKMIGYFRDHAQDILILEKIQFPLLKSVPADTFHEYIGSMITQLRLLHSIKSDTPGLLVSPKQNTSWKELLLFRYSGKHPWFDWVTISNRENVQKAVLLSSVANISQLIQSCQFPQAPYALLHTDFNQRNLFVNPQTKTIAGIVDWTEAMFGDPLYDFARVRLLIWHFNLQNHSTENYFAHLQLSGEEKIREEIYFVSLMLDYINWYSEKKNDFNDARLIRHQNFLKNYHFMPSQGYL